MWSSLYNIKFDHLLTPKTNTYALKVVTHLLWSYGRITLAKLVQNKFRNTRAKKFMGGQKLTWLKQIEKEVKFLDIGIEQAIEQTQNRKQ